MISYYDSELSGFSNQLTSSLFLVVSRSSLFDKLRYIKQLAIMRFVTGGSFIL